MRSIMWGDAVEWYDDSLGDHVRSYDEIAIGMDVSRGSNIEPRDLDLQGFRLKSKDIPPRGRKQINYDPTVNSHVRLGCHQRAEKHNMKSGHFFTDCRTNVEYSRIASVLFNETDLHWQETLLLVASEGCDRELGICRTGFDRYQRTYMFSSVSLIPDCCETKAPALA